MEETTRLAEWLHKTTSSDEATVRTATAALEEAEHFPGFEQRLLRICSEGQQHAYGIAAATYLKKHVTKQWKQQASASADGMVAQGGQGEGLSAEGRDAMRGELLQAALRAQGPVLRVLVELFRAIVAEDHKADRWQPALVPALRAALQASDMLNRGAPTDVKTLNALMLLKALIRPFQYFVNPAERREAVPPELEAVTRDLLVPLLPLFHSLVSQALQTREQAHSENDPLLLLLCKCLHLTVRSYMPASLAPSLGAWLQNVTILVECTVVNRSLAGGDVDGDDDDEVEACAARARVWKRALQICKVLVDRHRAHIDRHLPRLCTAVTAIACSAAHTQELSQQQERVLALSFDLIASILQTRPGWKLLANQFAHLLEDAIFPALCLKPMDVEEWEVDDWEYLHKNLPTDLDASLGWHEETYSARRSAISLLGFIATAKGPHAPPRSSFVVSKRKKGGGATRDANGNSEAGGGAGGDASTTAGKDIVLPFLLRFPFPVDGFGIDSKENAEYYGVLLAYASLREFLGEQPVEPVGALLHARVLSLYALTRPSPYVLANANWLLGELASVLPERLEGHVYTALMQAAGAPDVAGGPTWCPVRASAIAALSALVEANVQPPAWLPVLQAAVRAACEATDDEALLALQFLDTCAQAGGLPLVTHIPSVVDRLITHVCNLLPPAPTPWPQVVEAAYDALRALVDAWSDEGTFQIIELKAQAFALADADADAEARRAAAGGIAGGRGGGGGGAGGGGGGGEGTREGSHVQVPDGGVSLAEWQAQGAQLASAAAHLLTHCWLSPGGQGGCHLSPEAAPPPSSQASASALLRFLLRHMADADAASKARIDELLAAWAALISVWAAWEEEESAVAFQTIDEAILLQARCPLPHFAMAPMPPPPAPPVRPRSTAEAIAAFLVLNLQTAPLGCLYATCWRVHGLLYACKLSSGGEATSAVIAGWLAEAAMTHMVSNPHMSHPTTKMLTLVIATCLASAPHSVVPPLARAAASSLPLLPAPHQQPLPLPPARCQAEDDPVGGLVLWAETLLTFVGGQSAHRCSSEDELKTAVLGLAALVQYLAKSSHGQSQQKLAHRALSAAMDALLELRDLRASADMEDAEGSDNEDEEDEDEEDEEDGKEGEESEEEGEDRGGRGRAHGLGEETDEEFDRRYAEIARRMQEEREEAEDDGGDVDSEERSVPKELGMVDQRNETEALLACLKAHGPALFSQHPPPQELIVRFTEAYGEAASTFPAL